MTKIQCIYPNRDAVLAGYLYDDIDKADRVAFESHLATCRWCDDELASLRGVRETLAQWAPPEPARAFSHQSAVFSHQPLTTDHRPPTTGWWHTVPVWAQVAAAMLVLGASASIANLDIRYDRSGLRVTTGWSKPAPAAAPAATATAPAPAAAVAATAQMSDDEFNRRARALLADSEKRQQQELAVRLVQLQSEVNELLQNDRSRTNQLFRDVTDTYGSQIQNQQQQIRLLLPLSGR
jgi:hypothetical protein